MPIILAKSSGKQTEIQTAQYFLKMDEPKYAFVVIIGMIGIVHEINSLIGLTI